MDITKNPTCQHGEPIVAVDPADTRPHCDCGMLLARPRSIERGMCAYCAGDAPNVNVGGLAAAGDRIARNATASRRTKRTIR